MCSCYISEDRFAAFVVKHRIIVNTYGEFPVSSVFYFVLVLMQKSPASPNYVKTVFRASAVSNEIYCILFNSFNVSDYIAS